MNWLQLTGDQAQNNNAFEIIDWSHSFIREVSLVSPSYICTEDRGTVAPDCLPSARVFITSSSPEAPGLELLFVDVEDFCVWFGGDLNPEITITKDGVKWSFNKSASASIKSQLLYYRFLDSKSWGSNLRYIWEDIYNAAGEFIFFTKAM